jgi:hypothetical protein
MEGASVGQTPPPDNRNRPPTHTPSTPARRRLPPLPLPTSSRRRPGLQAPPPATTARLHHRGPDTRPPRRPCPQLPDPGGNPTAPRRAPDRRCPFGNGARTGDRTLHRQERGADDGRGVPGVLYVPGGEKRQARKVSPQRTRRARRGRTGRLSRRAMRSPRREVTTLEVPAEKGLLTHACRSSRCIPLSTDGPATPGRQSSRLGMIAGPGRSTNHPPRLGASVINPRGQADGTTSIMHHVRGPRRPRRVQMQETIWAEA